MPDPYRRPQFEILSRRLGESRRFIQVVSGPRQVGKTTLVRQVLADGAQAAHAVTADDPGLRDSTWLAAQWQVARQMAAGQAGKVLVVDEVQKVQDWSETVKRLWDEDTATGELLHVVLLGSAALPIERGLSESLAGRF